MARSPEDSLLIDAVAKGDHVRTAELLGAGADPNICTVGYPLLCRAAAAGDLKVVKLLLAAGATPQLLDARMGASALHKAAQSGVVEIAEVLVRHGAFIDLQAPTHGHTPLIDAVLHRKLAMVHYLLEAGANVLLTARGMLAPAYTALDLARRRRDRSIIDALKAREAWARGTILPPLHAATKMGDEASVSRLLDAGADPNQPAPVVGGADDGHTPMHIAARDGHAQIARLLIERGGRADVFDHFMRATPGHKAAALNHPKVLMVMAKGNAGLDLEAQGPYNGYTALHDAVWWGHPEAVRTLVRLGARRDVRGLDGRTALDIAIEDGQEECLSPLSSK
jgi:ankyrin repeat protein